MNPHHKIKSFITAGHEHLNAVKRQRAGLWALLIFGFIALIVESIFIVRGYRVPRLILLIPLFISLVVASWMYIKTRYSNHQAIQKMDQFFQLKEGLVTANEQLNTSKKSAFRELQIQHTEKVLSQCDPLHLRTKIPKKMILLSAGLIVISLGLLWVEDSLAVQQARADDTAMLQLSADVIDEVEETFEEILNKADEETAALLENEKLKELIESMEAQTDRLVVMRKLSEIDQQIAKMQSEMDTRADENYLQELGEQLRQSKETASLGDALSQRDYRKAAAELNNMQLGENNSAKKQKNLESLGARIGEIEKTMSNSQSGSRRNAQELNRQIKKMSQEQKKEGTCSKECQCKLNQSICKNKDGMQKLGARKEAESALDQLRKQLQQCQSAMEGRQPSNGLQAGNGVDRAFRSPDEQSPAIGNFEQLSGQLNEGESESVIEQAETGSGVTSESLQKNRPSEYKQQVETFVRREDIPEEVKQGVKIYFKQIHKMENNEEGAE